MEVNVRSSEGMKTGFCVCLSSTASRTDLWRGNGSGTSVPEDHGKFFLLPWETHRSETTGTSVKLLPSILSIYISFCSFSSSFFSSCLHTRLFPPVLCPFSHFFFPASECLSVVYPGFYFDTMEITPPAIGVHQFDGDDNKVGRETFTHRKRESLYSDVMWPVSPVLVPQVFSVSPQVEVRAVVEGQFLSRRLHAERLGYSISKTWFSFPCFLLFNYLQCFILLFSSYSLTPVQSVRLTVYTDHKVTHYFVFGHWGVFSSLSPQKLNVF